MRLPPKRAEAGRRASFRASCRLCNEPSLLERLSAARRFSICPPRLSRQGRRLRSRRRLSGFFCVASSLEVVLWFWLKLTRLVDSASQGYRRVKILHCRIFLPRTNVDE